MERRDQLGWTGVSGRRRIVGMNLKDPGELALTPNSAVASGNELPTEDDVVVVVVEYLRDGILVLFVDVTRRSLLKMGCFGSMESSR